MKKRTKKIGSLLLAAVMAISAVPVVSIDASAANGLPDFEFELRTNADKGSRSDSVTVTQADLEGGYTLSVGGYIVSENFPTGSDISNASMSWKPVDADGNDAYKYIHFANMMDKQTRGEEKTTTLSDGTTISSKWTLYCLTPYNAKTGKVATSGVQQFGNQYLTDDINNNDIFYDGKGGAYFIKDGTRVDCTVTDNGDGTTTLTYPYNDLSTGELKTNTMVTYGFDPAGAADTAVPGPCDNEFVSIGVTAQKNTFTGATSDELPFTTFDVVISPDTPTGTYYIAFHDKKRNYIGTSNYLDSDPVNMEYIKDAAGTPIGTTRNDMENWLKIDVQNGAVTTGDTTTTTTGDTTTTTTGDTTTTTSGTTAGPKPDGYSWVAGEYWATAGDTDFGITPTVYNDPGDITAIKVKMATSALENGAIKPTALGNKGMELGDAYPDFADMTFTVDKMVIAGSATYGVEPAEDGSAIGTWLYDVADKDTVVAAATKAGLTLQTDAEHGNYYSFPLEFDPSIDPALGSPRCEAVLASTEQRIPTTYVAGVINIIVGDVDPSSDYTWKAGEYWATAGDTDFGITPTVYNDPGDITAIKVKMATSALENGAIKPTAAGNKGMELGDAYPDFADMTFTVDKMVIAGSATYGVEPAEDGSAIGTWLYDVADKDTVIAAATKAGLTLQTDAEHGNYYSFPLTFDPSIDPSLGSPKCEAVLASTEQRIPTTYVAGVINIIVGDVDPSSDYTWKAGEYWATAGDTDFGITPTVYNDPGDITAIKVKMATSALENGAIKPTAAGNKGMELGDAYPDFADMTFTVDKMVIAGSATYGVEPAEDGSAIGTWLYDVADSAAVTAAATKAGLTLQHDEEHGNYYSFPLTFDPSIDPSLGSPRCEAVLASTEQRLKTTYVAGVINIIVKDVDPKESGWYAGEYWVNAGDTATVSPYVIGDPGTLGFIVDLDTDLMAEMSNGSATVGSAYSVFNVTLFNPDAFKMTASHDTQAVTAPDESAMVDFKYDISDADAIKALADSLGIALKHDAEHGAYYPFPLTFNADVNEAADADNNSIELTLHDGVINVIVPEETTTTTTTTTTTESETTTTTEEGTTTTPEETTTTTEEGTTTTPEETTTTTTTTESETTTTTTTTTTTGSEETTTTTTTTTTTGSEETTTTTTTTTTTGSETTTTTTESETTTTTTESETTTTTTTTTTGSGTTTTTTSTTTTTTTTTTGEVYAVSSEIVYEAIEPNFYFSVDDREFKAADLFNSIILKVTYSDGSETEEDIMDKVDFGGLTPEALFENRADDTDTYDGVYRGYVSANYNGEKLDAQSLVYVGVKGDSTLDGQLQPSDATLVLTYYARNAAQLDAAFTDDVTSDYEKLAFFLADVNTESKAGVNTDDARIEVSDATNILTYYARNAAVLHPEWQQIIPSLVDIPNSLWAYKAGK